MPNIKITEVSKIGASAIESDSNLVLIPVKIKSADNVNKTIMLNSSSALEKATGVGQVLNGLEVKDKMFISYVLNAGLPVLAYIYGGQAGSEALLFSDVVKDPSLYNIRFVTSTTPDDDKNKAAIKGLVDARQDCTAIFGVSKKPSVADNSGKNCYVIGPNIKLVGDQNEYSGALGYLLAYAESTRVHMPWYPVAGVNGAIPLLESTSLEIGELEANKNWLSNNVNPIATISGVGKVIWGNLTAASNSLAEPGTSYITPTSPFNFMSTRNVLMTLRKTLRTACRISTFKPNTNVLWLDFKNMITPTLDKMKSSEGISDYKIYKKKTPNKTTLGAIVSITPVFGVEDFDIEIVLTDEGGLEIEVLQ